MKKILSIRSSLGIINVKFFCAVVIYSLATYEAGFADGHCLLPSFDSSYVALEETHKIPSDSRSNSDDPKNNIENEQQVQFFNSELQWDVYTFTDLLDLMQYPFNFSSEVDYLGRTPAEYKNGIILPDNIPWCVALSPAYHAPGNDMPGLEAIDKDILNSEIKGLWLKTTDIDFEELAQLKCLGSLKYYRLDDNTADYDDPKSKIDLTHISKMHDLRKLMIDSNRVSLSSLTELKACSKLESLTLRVLAGLDVNALEIIRSFPRLKYLRLEIASIEKLNLKPLEAAESLETLVLVIPDRALMEQEGLEVIPKIKNLKNLDLFLGCKKRNIEILEPLNDAKQLRSLAIALETTEVESPQQPLLSVISELTSLQQLSVQILNQEDLNGIERLKGLTTLQLEMQPISEAIGDIKNDDGSIRTTLYHTAVISKNACIDLKVLQNSKQLASLTLKGIRISQNGFGCLEKLKNLSSLTLEDFDKGEAGLAGIQKISNLQTLMITKRNAWSPVNRKMIMDIGGCSSLRTLDISQAFIPSKEFLALRDSMVPFTTNRFVVENVITNESLNMLSRLSNLHTLKAPAGVSDKGMEIISKLDALVHLDIRHGIFSDEGMKSISKLKELETLNLSGCRFITDKTLVEIAKLTKLQKLNLNTCQRHFNQSMRDKHAMSIVNISDRGISSLEQLKYLASLSLRNNRTVSGRYLDRLSSLSELDISGTKIDAEVFSSGTKLKKLKRIWIAGSFTRYLLLVDHFFSPEGLDKIRQQYPALEFKYSPYR